MRPNDASTRVEPVPAFLGASAASRACARSGRRSDDLVGEGRSGCGPARPRAGSRSSLSSTSRLVGQRRGGRPRSSTVERSWALQYSGCVASVPGPVPGLGRDVGQLRLGEGDRRPRPARTRRASDPSSTSGRRATCADGGPATDRGVERRARRASIAGVGPDSTLKPGALTAASATSSSSRSATSVARRHHREHRPGGKREISRPRRASSRRASSSAMTPASVAATYSPMLWPIIAVGSIPQERHSSRERVLDDEQRGLRQRGVAQLGVGAPRRSIALGNSTSRRSRPRSGSKRRRSTSSIASRTTGSVWYSVAGHARVLRALAGEHEHDRGRRRRAPVPGAGPASRSTAAASRRGRSGRRRSCGGDGTPAARRAACRRRRRGPVRGWRVEVVAEAAGRLVEGVVAPRREGEQHRATGRACRRRDGGASSSTACAFVPPTPNELTAARRGVPLRDHGSSEVVTKNGLDGEVDGGVRRLVVQRSAGSRRARGLSTVLIRPATPAAHDRWPKFDFTEPIPQNPRRSVWARNTSVSADELDRVAEDRARAVRLDVADRCPG